ncbi:MAG TPA: NFACT family protein [Nitrospira sp.]|nr:NFACT family protein [Nitrospira sp.]
MALTATDIAHVLSEIVPVLTKGWIQKIHQPADRVLVFEIRVPGETYRLLISCEPETARLHLSFRSVPNPPSPPPFCQFLRARLQGARLDEMKQLSEDRIVALDLTTKDGSRRVVCEFTGKTANILMLDEHQQVMGGLLRQKQFIGQPYHVPLKRPSTSTPDTASRFTATPSHGRFPFSAAIEALYQDKETLLALDQARDKQLQGLRKLLKKTQRRIEAWRDDLAKASKYGDYARYGELIKANLSSIKTGMNRITLVDYYDETLPEVTLPLDTTKSAQGNMDDFFKKYRKHLAAERELKPRITQAEHDLDTLRQEITAIQQGTWIDPLSSSTPARTASRPPSRAPKESSDQRRGPFRRFTSTDGLPIFVGRNARENEELTFRLAKSDDLWLHARGTPGSHVVVRLGKGTDPPPETLRDAATLALLYSDLKKSGKGEVIYTRRKWVKKAKGQAAGAVIVTEEKPIFVKLDTQRLAALKERKN